MQRFARVLQFAGIVVAGIGLFYGIAQNDMRMEFSFLGAGILLFVAGVFLGGRR